MSVFEDWDLLEQIDEALMEISRQLDVQLCRDDLADLCELQAESAFHRLESSQAKHCGELLWRRLYSAIVVRSRRERLNGPASTDLRDYCLMYPADMARVGVPAPAPTIGEQLIIAKYRNFVLRETEDPDLVRTVRVLKARLAKLRQVQMDKIVVQMSTGTISWPESWVSLLIRLDMDPWLGDLMSKPPAVDSDDVMPRLAVMVIRGARRALNQRRGEASWAPWFIRWHRE